MLHKLHGTVLIIVLLAATPALCESWEGIWAGGTNALGEAIFIQVALTGEGPSLRGTLEVPSQDSTFPLRDVLSGEKTIAFRAATPFGVFAFDGTLDAGVVRGTVATPMGTSAAFHLLRTGPPRDVRELAGVWRFDDGETMISTPRTDGQLRLVSATALTSMRLLPVAGDRFLDGASIVKDPAAGRFVEFLRENGKPPALALPDDKGPIRRGRRLDVLDQEEVRFANGAVRLSGTFFKPRTAPPWPAVVVVHGSGAVTRDLVLLRAQLLMRLGIAVLLYDKRGTGESGGDWTTASFEDLAGDAAAAVRTLRARKDVDTRKIGLVGHSQAGWIIPIVVKREPAVAFAVIASGGGVTPFDQEVYRAETETRDDFTEPAAKAAKELTSLMWRYAKSGDGWDDYERAWKKASHELWFGNVGGPGAKDDPLWAQVRAFAAYDPIPFLAAMRVPTLVVLGGDDPTMPTARAAAIWRDTMRDRKGFSLVIVRGAGHNLIGKRKNGTYEYEPEYVNAMTRWLQGLDVGKPVW